MATRDGTIHRADRDALRALATLGREIRDARVAAGLSQTAVGRNAGVSHTQVSRLERGQLRSASLRLLVLVTLAVGLDLSVRAYPGGDAVRDAAHVRLLERLRRRIHPALGWRTEVPLPIPGDRRAWDAVIRGSGWTVGVEAETRVTDVQALTRKLELKRRDGGLERVVLLLADTRTNRAALALARSGMDALMPGTHGATLGALAQGRDPGTGGIVML